MSVTHRLHSVKTKDFRPFDSKPNGRPVGGGMASLKSSTAGINTTETTIVSYTVPANSIQAGTVYRIKVFGTCTTSRADTTRHNIRFGPTGKSTDTAITSYALTTVGTGTNVPYTIEFYITFQSTTA
jgi:hypothetical protein